MANNTIKAQRISMKPSTPPIKGETRVLPTVNQTDKNSSTSLRNVANKKNDELEKILGPGLFNAFEKLHKKTIETHNNHGEKFDGVSRGVQQSNQLLSSMIEMQSRTIRSIEKLTQTITVLSQAAAASSTSGGSGNSGGNDGGGSRNERNRNNRQQSNSFFSRLARAFGLVKGLSPVQRILGLGKAAIGLGGLAYGGYKFKQEYDKMKGMGSQVLGPDGQPNPNISKISPQIDNVPSQGGPANGAGIGQRGAMYGNVPLTEEQRNELGALSEKYESGGRGVGFISSGKDDPGGQSYGKHQLSTQYSMGAFLRSPEGAPFASAFHGLTPGTPQFNEVYKKIAGEKGKEFGSAQKNFLARTHYNPLLEHAKKLGFDVNNRGIQEALFSMSIQHRKAKKILDQAAANGVGKTPQQQLDSIYDARSKYVGSLSTLNDKMKSSIQNRFRREHKDAIQYSMSPEEYEGRKQAARKENNTGTSKLPSTSGVPEDILTKAKEVALLGPEALSKFMRDQGYPKNSAWCGDFAAAVVTAAGGTPPKNPQVASNWRNFGQKVDTPQPGDIAVRKPEFSGRRGPGTTGKTGSHVNIVEGTDGKGNFRFIGGNQGSIKSRHKIHQYDFYRNPPKKQKEEQGPNPKDNKIKEPGKEYDDGSKEILEDNSPSKPIPKEETPILRPPSTEEDSFIRPPAFLNDGVVDKSPQPATPPPPPPSPGPRVMTIPPPLPVAPTPQPSAQNESAPQPTAAEPMQDAFFNPSRPNNPWAPSILNYWKQGKEGLHV